MSKPMPKRAFITDQRALGATSAAKAAWWIANGFAVRAAARVGKRGVGKGGSVGEEAGDRARAFRPKSPPPDRARLRQAWFEAFRKDAEDVAAGLYPASETPKPHLLQPVARAVDLVRDARQVEARRRRRAGVEARAEANGEAYPAYYRQNFHYQSGGWFTAESARRYEAQVEALFSGAAGPMRRRALSLLARAWKGKDQRNARVLDLACGSGAFLADLRAAFPRAAVMGADLSHPYAREALRRGGAATLQAMAERLPFADASLDAVTCIFLFHELPPRVRTVVAAEIARVLKPGGIFAFADSVQGADEPGLERFLEVFPAFFHEPFYASYQALDLAALFEGAGLRAAGRDQAFLTKALLFEKP